MSLSDLYWYYLSLLKIIEEKNPATQPFVLTDLFCVFMNNDFKDTLKWMH